MYTAYLTEVSAEEAGAVAQEITASLILQMVKEVVVPMVSNTLSAPPRKLRDDFKTICVVL